MPPTSITCQPNPLEPGYDDIYPSSPAQDHAVDGDNDAAQDDMYDDAQQLPTTQAYPPPNIIDVNTPPEDRAVPPTQVPTQPHPEALSPRPTHTEYIPLTPESTERFQFPEGDTPQSNMAPSSPELHTTTGHTRTAPTPLPAWPALGTP